MNTLLLLFLAVFHVAGLLSTFSALMTARTSQGAIAWVMSLITFPYVALPMYWIFGRTKFHGYIKARRSRDAEFQRIRHDVRKYESEFVARFEDDDASVDVLERLAGMPFLLHNEVELLIDGEATFGSIFKGIESAKEYLLVQFFIIHDDELGNELKKRLIRKARDGVRIYMLYDEIGSHKLGRTYLQELREEGIDVRPFATTMGWTNRFQLNFRNHRKIVVADGLRAYVGGLNVGDEYMGRSKRFGHWRDTHLKLEGPSVLEVQLSFVEDWHWAAHSVPSLNWKPIGTTRDGADKRVLVLPTGPADDQETCNLMFIEAINTAQRRIWIVSPYFVPDMDIIHALQLAALRGVDIRIMLPAKADHMLVFLASFSYLDQLAIPGIRFFRYGPGFLHQKVMLVDDALSMIGTANADNRSFRLNFEITVVVFGGEFARKVEWMLKEDFTSCREAGAEDYRKAHPGFRFAVRIARLFSPIL